MQLLFIIYSFVWRSWLEFVKYLQNQASNKSGIELVEVEEEMQVLENHIGGTNIVSEMISIGVD